jgi:hypothetical protein
MAAWLTVYCSRPVRYLTAADLLARLRDIEDVHTLAEGFGIDDDTEVDRALAQLRIDPVTGPDGARFRLRYRRASYRPVLVYHWTAAKRVRDECAEALEQFEGTKERNANRVRTHLAQCVAVVALELGWTQLDNMGIVFASQLAEFFAVTGTGLIRDQNDDWWAMKKNGLPVLLVGQRGGS